MPDSRRLKRTPGRRRLPGYILPVLAIALTLLFRLWFIIEMRGQPFSLLSPHVVDSWYYHNRALAILAGDLRGTEVFFLRPLYPYLLALVYAVFGRGNVLWVQLLQTVMAGASCLLLFDSTRRMFGRAAAAIAAVGFALCGILVLYTGTLLYVELTILLSLLTVWLVLVADGHWWRWLLAGISFGLLTICRPEFLLLLPVFIAILALRRTRPGLLAVMTGTALIVIASVPVRNLVIARDPVLFTAHSGFNFYYGNNPAADGTWQPAPELENTVGFSHRRLKRIGRVIDGHMVAWSQASNHWLNRGLHYLATHPRRALELAGRKFLLFCAGYEIPSNYYPETARAVSVALRFAFVGFALVFAFGVLGMIRAWHRRNRTWPAYLVIGIHLLSALTFYVMSRLRAPVIPFLLMFAGFAVAELTTAARARHRKTVALGLLLVAALFIGSLLVPADRAGYSSQAWTQLGNIYLSHRQPKPAMDAFRRALDANPDNPGSRYSLLVLLAGSGRAREAEEQYVKIARRAGTDPRLAPVVHMAAARIAIARRDFAAAVSDYHQAIAADPDNAEPWYMLGLVYVSIDSLDRARRALTRALEIDPAHSEARATLARLAGHR